MSFRIILHFLFLVFLAGCTTTIPETKSAETYFREGEDLYKKKNYEESVTQLKKVKEYGASNPALNAMVDLKIADAQFEAKNYIEAAATYESFVNSTPRVIRCPMRYIGLVSATTIR